MLRLGFAALQQPSRLQSSSALTHGIAARKYFTTRACDGASDAPSLLSRARKIMSVPGRLSKLSHFSNVTRFLGLTSPDLLVLQSFMVVASSSNALYSLLQPKPLYVPFSYGAVFTLLSASIVVQIASERFVTLTDEEEHIYDAHFAAAFDRAHFKKLLALSRGMSAGSSEKRIKVMRKGEAADLFLLLEGGAEITFEEPRRAIVPRGPGLIGEIGFTIACSKRAEARTAVADIDMIGQGSRWVSWDGDVLREAMAKDAMLKRSVDHLVGLSLSSKLRESYCAPTEHQAAVEPADEARAAGIAQSYRELWRKVSTKGTR